MSANNVTASAYNTGAPSAVSPGTAADTAGPMILGINVASDQEGGGLGRAHTMAVATIANGRIVNWDEIEVRWDLSHDHNGEGRHHATIVRFMREHNIQVVVSGHMGPPMANTLRKLGVVPLVGAEGPAQDVALAAAAFVQDHADEFTQAATVRPDTTLS